jgi:hypothetical protein
MITTEERLRAATRAAAATVPPGNAPPLRLPDEPIRRRGRAHGDQHRRGWLRAMTPLAAAAAVAGVVIASLLLTSRTPPGSSAGPASGTSALRGVPPYYAALVGPPDAPEHAVIRASATGAVLATVKPPRPYGSFTFVSGAADDRTFVLAAQRWWNVTSGTRGENAQQRDNTTPVVFFRLRFDPATRTTGLTALHVPQKITAASLSGIGLSPDGTKLAMTQHQAEIDIVTLATGSARHWVWPGSAHSTRVWAGNDKPSGQPVSWTADGRSLAFPLTTESGGITYVCVLDTTAPGRSLRSARRSVTFLGLGHLKSGPIGNALITADGTRIVTVTQRGPARAQVTEFSVRTGQALSPAPAGTITGPLVPWDVLWADPSGGALIIEADHSPSANASVTGVLRGGRFTPLPGAPVETNNVAW